VYLSRRVPDGVQVAIKHIVMPPDAKIQRVLLSEVEIMKTLKHKNIVQYFDSNITGKEIFIAMKYCPYSLVQAMNSKMQTKFSEQEVLKIMKETTEAVLYLHYLQPPIVHRDIKVENILICQNGREPVFKLCDFGSCTTRIIPPRTTLSSSEISALEDELERQTTLAYRAPEMLDLYRKRGLTEKTDVWAMGNITVYDS
jgi:serine/threonine protein kinase